MLSRPAITSVEIAKRFCKRLFDERGLDRESFAVIPLDTKYRPICAEFATTGTLDSSLVHPREVFKLAIHVGACAILIAHNHPSGDIQPSSADFSVTRQLKSASDILGISIVDHIITGESECYSFKESTSALG